MIRINLSLEVKSQSAASKALIALLILAVFAGAAFLIPEYYAGLVEEEAEEIRLKTSQVRAKIKELRISFDEIKKLEQEKRAADRRMRRVRQLNSSRKQPVYFLDSLQQQHLEGLMWLIELDLSHDQNVSKSHVKVKGFATDHSIVSEYVRRLKNINGENTITDQVVEEYTPEFIDKVEKTDIETEIAQVKQIKPLKIENVDLKYSQTEEVENVRLRTFSLEMDVNTGLE